jgi:hypothetical protein
LFPKDIVCLRNISIDTLHKGDTEDDDDDDDDDDNNNNNNNKQLHFNICKGTGVQLDKKHWYKHVPKSVETGQGGNVTIL